MRKYKGKKKDEDSDDEEEQEQEEEEEEEEDSRIIISEVSNQSTMDSLSHLTIDMKDRDEEEEEEEEESDRDAMKKSREDMDVSPSSSQQKEEEEEEEEKPKEDKKTRKIRKNWNLFNFVKISKLVILMWMIQILIKSRLQILEMLVGLTNISQMTFKLDR